MILKYFNYFLLYLFLQIKVVELYIVIPLKSTDNLYFSKKSKYITIDDIYSISKLFTKLLNNTLYTDLIVGEPKQEATAFLTTEEYGFTFYEEYSTKELKELDINNYNEYLRNKSESIVPSNELNFNFSFWEYLSYEEPFFMHKFNDTEIFSIENFNSKERTKINNIHFLYAIRHSEKVPNTTSYIEFENRYQSTKDELRKLNYTSFSYFYLGLQVGGKKYYKDVKNILGELVSKKHVSLRDWSIYFPMDKLNNNNIINNNSDYIAYLILGSKPEIYLSNKYKEQDAFYTNSESYDWTYVALIHFYKSYFKVNEEIISINKFDLKAKLDFNFGIIKGTSYCKHLLEETFFNSLIKEGKCFQSKVSKISYAFYDYFYCDKNKISKNDLSKFPTLFFHHIEFSNIFELTYEDLFETVDDVIIFKIVFDMSNEWTFGRLFLKKYIFSYNDDSKKIAFYNTKYQENEEKDEKNLSKNNSYYYYIELVIIIFLLFFFAFLGFYIGKIIYKKYKKDADELEEIDNEQFNSLNKDQDNNNNYENNKLLDN